MLSTPDSIRTLQRKLYAKAKQEPGYRFYALYDKVWRADVLAFAWRLVRANKGSPGVDGVNFEDIEQKTGVESFLAALAQDLKEKTYKPDPVRRVMIPKASGGMRPLGIPTIRDRVAQQASKLVIEPILDADFCDTSYGFRPKKTAQDAIDDIADKVWKGYTQVIDADLSKYFDTIPHEKLLKTVAERIVDGGILHLIKMWLKAPVIGEDSDGARRNVGGGKAASKGTPQGGVISPLLSNCYLHLLDRIWQRHRFEEKLGARIVRYADDFVVLCRRDADMEEVRGRIDYVLSRLELTLNEEKTRTVDARTEGFNFLGFTIKLCKSRKSGRAYPHVCPSDKAFAKIRQEVKTLTARERTMIPLQDVVKSVNAAVRGWCNYFHHRNCTTVMRKLGTFVSNRLRIHLCKRHKVKNFRSGFLRFPYKDLHDRYGLYKVPTRAPWKSAHAVA